MSAAATKMNLRPQERRLIALVGLVLFVVLNVVFVWPHFGDWSRLTYRRERAERTLASYNAEIAKTNGYNVKLRELESAGSSVVPDEQDLDLVRRVDVQARQNGLYVLQLDPRPKQSQSQTNRFFEEEYVTLHATSDNEQLVNFLVSLTSTNSLIRVKDLTLKPADAGATKLDANMTLVASYQRKTPVRVHPPSTPTPSNTPAAKPAGTRALTRTNKIAQPLPAGGSNRPPLVRNRGTNQPPKRP
jgi:type II secretory pathway component PulM